MYSKRCFIDYLHNISKERTSSADPIHPGGKRISYLSERDRYLKEIKVYFPLQRICLFQKIRQISLFNHGVNNAWACMLERVAHHDSVMVWLSAQGQMRHESWGDLSWMLMVWKYVSSKISSFEENLFC